jgi:hypothetical protein
MRKVYENFEYSRVGHFQSILDSSGIATHVKNFGAGNAAGEVVATEVYPELWVVNDEDYEKAIELLKPLLSDEASEGADWQCPQCGETVVGTLSECWNCQTPDSPVDVETEDQS